MLALQATYFNGNVIEVTLPKQMVLEVVETDPGEKGNTAQGATKVEETPPHKRMVLSVRPAWQTSQLCYYYLCAWFEKKAKELSHYSDLDARTYCPS